MLTILKIMYPPILDYNEKFNEFGNILIKRIFTEYEDIKHQKELKMDINLQYIDISGKKIRIETGINYCILVLGNELKNEQKNEILNIFKEEIIAILGVEIITNIGFQFQKEFELNDTRGIEIVKKYFYNTNSNSPFSSFKDKELCDMKIRASYKEEKYILNMIVELSDEIENSLSIFGQYEYSYKGLSIDKIFDYQRFEKKFIEDYKLFIRDISELN